MALGNASAYSIDGAHDISSHTNPALFATERATGRKVVLKLRLNAFELAADGSVTVPSNGRGWPELEAGRNGFYSRRWARCDDAADCIALARRGGHPAANLRRVPSEPARTARLRWAAGAGSLRDELFVHALLSPQTCGSGVGDGITPLLDVLEFSPSTAPPALRVAAANALREGATPPATRAQSWYIYALVFPRYAPAPPRGAMSRAQAAQAEMRGLLTALATASRRGVINVDLRSGHMMYDVAGRTFRLTDWDNAVAVEEAAGGDAEFPRDDAASCATHVPAVPTHIWGEVLHSAATVAPESLFAWLDGGRAGCRFSPALDIWHAGLRLAELLGCPRPLAPSALRPERPGVLGAFQTALSAIARLWGGGPKQSVVSTLANIYGTRALYALLDAHGWRLDRSCSQICTPLAGPLKFTREAVNDCVRQCSARASVDPALASRKGQTVEPRTLMSWCHDSASAAERSGYDLLERMLALDPARRIDAASALEHPFVSRSKPAARPTPLARAWTNRSIVPRLLAKCGPLPRDVCTLELQSKARAAARAHNGTSTGPRVGYVLLAMPFSREPDRVQGPIAAAGVLQSHVRTLATLPSDLVRKLYVMVPSERGKSHMMGFLDVGAAASRLPYEAVLALMPNNTLGSYGMYLEAFRLSEAAGDRLDYFIFSEDDYVPMRPDFDRVLVRMYRHTFDKNDGVLCGVLQGRPVEADSTYDLHLESSHIISARSLRRVFERAYRAQPAWPSDLTARSIHLLEEEWVNRQDAREHVLTSMNYFDKVQQGFAALMRDAHIPMRDWTSAYRTPYWNHEGIIDYSGAAHNYSVPLNRVLFAPLQWSNAQLVRLCCAPADCSSRRSFGLRRVASCYSRLQHWNGHQTGQPKQPPDSCCPGGAVPSSVLRVRARYSVPSDAVDVREARAEAQAGTALGAPRPTPSAEPSASRQTDRRRTIGRPGAGG